MPGRLSMSSALYQQTTVAQMEQPQRQGHKRGPWSQAEDTFLMVLVNQTQPHNWVKIAETLGSRSAKQCRERYHQNLKPSLNHDPISETEGKMIEQMVATMGKRWADIARKLHGRSDNQVKNWWNGSMNRRKRLEAKRAQQQTGRPLATIGHQRRLPPLASLYPSAARTNATTTTTTTTTTKMTTTAAPLHHQLAPRVAAHQVSIPAAATQPQEQHHQHHRQQHHHLFPSVKAKTCFATTPRMLNSYGLESPLPSPSSIAPSPQLSVSPSQNRRPTPSPPPTPWPQCRAGPQQQLDPHHHTTRAAALAVWDFPRRPFITCLPIRTKAGAHR